jgi:uncharacterized protein YycO
LNSAWKLWTTIVVLGAGVIYLGSKLVEVISANRSLASESNTQRQHKESALQQVSVESQQKNAAIQKSLELENKVADLKSKLDQLKPKTT